MALKNAGGMWVREGKRGKFLSGSFEPEGRDGVKYKFMAFKNEDYEEGGKKPYYRIVLSDDDETRGRDEQTSGQRARHDDQDRHEPF